MSENVERVEEFKNFKVGANREDVLAFKEAEIICELEHILIQDIVDRERFMAHGGKGDAIFRNFDGRKRFAEWCPKITEAIVTGKETVGPLGRATVDFQSKGVEFVVDPVSGILEWQAAFVRAAAGLESAQNKRVRR